MTGAPQPWRYEGPPEARALAERALRWVADPATGCDVLRCGLVRSVCVDEGTVRVRISPPSADAGLTALVVEDLQAELFDHFQGQRRVVVSLAAAPRGGPARTHLRRVA